MKYWYKSESFRVFPNIEITYEEKYDDLWLSLTWLKFVFSLHIML